MVYIYIHQNKLYLNNLEQVKIASNPEKVVNQSDLIILMLPNGQIVRDVCQSNIFPYEKSPRKFLMQFYSI
jgi:3-hydroxyisobutyrate dehydrogenase-like beta-hydroxyacid dehydrogenase